MQKKSLKKNKFLILFRFDLGNKFGLGNYRRLKPFISLLGKKHKVIIFTNSPDLIKEKIKKIKVNELNEEKKILNFIAHNKNYNYLTIVDKLKKYKKSFIKKIKINSKLIMFHNFFESSKYADILIFPIMHFTKNDSTKIQKLKTKNNLILYGKNYLIINKNIFNLKKKGKIKKNYIVISTGGSDPYDYTTKILKIFLLKKLNLKYKIIFLIGKIKKNKEVIKKKIKNISFKKFNYKDLISASLVVSTFGVITYELLFMKKKIINICYNHNSKKRAKLLDKSFRNIKSFVIKDNFSPYISLMSKDEFKIPNYKINTDGIKSIYKEIKNKIYD